MQAMNSEALIIACEERLYHAQLAAETEALDQLLDDELLFTGLNGKHVSKAEDLALHRSGQFRITRMQVIERTLRHLGDTAVVCARMDTQARIGSDLRDAVIQYTRVWHQTALGWRVVAGHMSLVQPNH
jgi:ketosteroid isomerase-like protein